MFFEQESLDPHNKKYFTRTIVYKSYSMKFMVP